MSTALEDKWMSVWQLPKGMTRSVKRASESLNHDLLFTILTQLPLQLVVFINNIPVMAGGTWLNIHWVVKQ